MDGPPRFRGRGPPRGMMRGGGRGGRGGYNGPPGPLMGFGGPPRRGFGPAGPRAPMRGFIPRGGRGMGRGVGRPYNSSQSNSSDAPQENGSSTATKPVAPASTNSNNVQVPTTGPTQTTTSPNASAIPSTQQSSTTTTTSGTQPPTQQSSQPTQQSQSQSESNYQGNSNGYRGGYRGRGSGFRGRGGNRGGYNSGPPMGQNNYGQNSYGQGNYRQGPPMGNSPPNRGRGGYNPNLSRPQYDTRQPSNTTTVTPIKRGPPGSVGLGGVGPKRGRYDNGPNQGMPRGPLPGPRPPPTSYGGPPNQMQYNQAPMQHHGYADPQSQVPVDPYSQAPQQHSGYGPPASQGYAPANGYSQQGYGTATTAYGTGTEYDQSQQYTDYSQSYGQHDTRYAQTSYATDYSQGYAQTGDYSTVATDQYAQPHYDDRSGYSAAGYDAYGYGKTDQYSGHAGYY